MCRFNGVDVLMLYFDGGSVYNYIFKISVFDLLIDLDGWLWLKVWQMFEECVYLFLVFWLWYLFILLGLYYLIWVEDFEFDFDVYVCWVVCFVLGGMVEFCVFVEQIYVYLLDCDCLLWQIWVVEGFDGGCVVLVMLLYYVYFDGVGVLDMFVVFYNDMFDEVFVVVFLWELLLLLFIW